MNRRRAARYAAVQALYQLEVGGSSLEAVIAEYQGHRLNDLLEPLEAGDEPIAVDRDWFVRITRGAWRRSGELDALIEPRLAAGWSLKRAGYLLRALLRAGTYEITAHPDVPTQVVTSEYVQLAHVFLNQDQAGFVNAVLDRLARELRSASPPPAPDAPADGSSSESEAEGK
jgi:N utilization substance protein B